jgi:hypothetical protein
MSNIPICPHGIAGGNYYVWINCGTKQKKCHQCADQKNEQFRDLRFIQFKHRMNELCYETIGFENCRNQPNRYINPRAHAHAMGRSAGHIFRLREFFYDRYNWRF